LNEATKPSDGISAGIYGNLFYGSNALFRSNWKKGHVNLPSTLDHEPWTLTVKLS